MNDEFRYKCSISNYVFIYVNSSIHKSLGGISASRGKDSIRAWLGDEIGKPLGSKTQKWVTRVPGWEKRVIKMLNELQKMGKQLKYCDKCGSIEKVFIAKTAKNKGRKFKKCNCNNSFQWLDAPKPIENSNNPICDKCGSQMVLRKSKYGKFWGCSNYPRCKNTKRYVDLKVQKVTEDVNINVGSDLRKRIKASKFVPSVYQQAVFDWADEIVGKAD